MEQTWYTQTSQTRTSLSLECSETRIHLKLLQVFTTHEPNMISRQKFTSIDFSCRGAEGSKSSKLQTLGNKLVNGPPYITYTNHKCYLLYYFHLNYE